MLGANITLVSFIPFSHKKLPWVTAVLLLESSLVRRHQFGNNQAHYEKCFFDKQHDHLILSDTCEVIEFCDPRIETIKKTIEEVFDVEIENHSLYFYGKKIDKK